MKYYDNVRTTTVAAVVAVALTLGGGVALAQTQAAGGPPGPGMHHRGGGGHDIGHLIVHAKAQLNLNTSQSGMFDAAVASSKAAFQSGHTIRQSVKDVLTAELAKPEPDLAAVAAAADNARAQGQALRTSVRAQWLALYATFSPDQKTVVKNLMLQHMADASAFHDKMMQRFHGAAPTATN